VNKSDKSQLRGDNTTSARTYKPQPQPRLRYYTPRQSQQQWGIRKAQAAIKCRKSRKVVPARHGGLDITEEAGLSELEAMKGLIYAALLVLEAALQSECSACQGVYKEDSAPLQYVQIYRCTYIVLTPINFRSTVTLFI